MKPFLAQVAALVGLTVLSAHSSVATVLTNSLEAHAFGSLNTCPAPCGVVDRGPSATSVNIGNGISDFEGTFFTRSNGNSNGVYFVGASASGDGFASSTFTRSLTIQNESTVAMHYTLPVLIFGGYITVDSEPGGEGTAGFNISLNGTTKESSSATLRHDGTTTTAGPTTLNGTFVNQPSATNYVYVWRDTALLVDLGTLLPNASVVVNVSAFASATSIDPVSNKTCPSGPFPNSPPTWCRLVYASFGDPSNPNGIAAPIAEPVLPLPASSILFGMGALLLGLRLVRVR
jgi:hypothetical protein